MSDINERHDRKTGWKGYDFDGVLSTVDYSEPYNHRIVQGEPIWPMIEHLKRDLAEGWTVKIFTARVSDSQHWRSKQEAVQALDEWCLKYIGRTLPLTAEKDYSLVKFYDDRAVCVERNTGRILAEPR